MNLPAIPAFLPIVAKLPFLIKSFAGVAITVGTCFRVLKQYEGGIILTFGKFSRNAEPGLVFLMPFGIQTLLKSSLALQTLSIEKQDVITKDNVSASISIAVNYRVIDPKRALLEVDNLSNTMSQFTQTALRQTISSHKLDDLIGSQESLSHHLIQTIDREAEKWGVHIEAALIRSVDLDPSIVRAMAAEAEAERDRRARIVTAQGELEAAELLAQAAKKLEASKNAMALRTLATLKEIGTDKNTVVIFPLAQDSMIPQQESGSLAQAIANSVAGSTLPPHEKSG